MQAHQQVVAELVTEKVGTKYKVKALNDGEVVHLDTIDLNNAPQRERFVKAVCKRLDGADATLLAAKLLKFAEVEPAPENPRANPPDPAVEVKIACTPGNDGRCILTAEVGGTTLHHDSNLDPLNAQHRARVIKALAEKCPGVDTADIEKQLLDIGDQLITQVQERSRTTGETGTDDATALLEKMPQDVRDEAAALLADTSLIKRVIDDVATLGVAGERELIATIYLTGTSRLLKRPLATRVHGPSSSGKSYVIERTVELLPPEAVILATQMTPQALFHMKPGSLAHQFIVAGERSRCEDDEAGEATRALREMLSAGRLSKLMPMKVEGGGIETVLIEQDGPIAFIESTTLTHVFDEDANRCLTLYTDERQEQTRKIITKLAERYSQGESGTEAARILQRHHALQRMLKSFLVVIPYAGRLGELFSHHRVEGRRAFPQLMSMIEAITLLHQRQRQTDGDGRLVATDDDYQLARHLLAKPMARLLGGGVSDPARRFYYRLKAWATGAVFTSSEAKKRESNSRSSVYGWLKDLHEAGCLEVVEEQRGRTPAKWQLTDRSPDEDSGIGLPALEDVFPELRRKHGHTAQSPAQKAVMCPGTGMDANGTRDGSGLCPGYRLDT
jgi:hypothetical protein